MSGLPQALDCIVSFQLIWGKITRHHMSGLEDKKNKKKPSDAAEFLLFKTQEA